MLEPLPSRSVTRFLLPLADVMTLLFAIFLLLPHLEQHPGQQTAQAMTPGSYWTLDEERNVRDELSRLRRLQQLRADQRLQIVVVDIDGKTGNLLLQEGSGQVVLTDENIDEVVQKHQAAARAGEKELFYLLRVPRPGGEGSPPHPDLADEARYHQYFSRRKVDYRIDYLRLPE